MRPIQATIHLRALAHNLGVAKAKAPNSKIMAVIKANGYGHGLLNAAAGLKNADGFAVLSLDEALALRNAGYQQTILLLEGVFSANELQAVSQHQISVVVHHVGQVEMLEGAQLAHPISVHLKINTGMNRLGFEPTDSDAMIKRLEVCSNVSEITLMTHFATADESQGIAAPLALFNQTTASQPYPQSLANSATVLRFPEAHAEWVRAGIMLYGSSPMADVTAASFNLKPVMSLSSEIIAIQHLEAGESVGYGHRFTADKPMRIGIVACGYADGYPRHAPNGTPIAVAGQLTQTIGRVSMDMLFVDLTHIPQANIGSSVELWGEQVPIDAVAQSAGTISYELLCALALRVPVKVVE
ncbi:MAG: alanine racemase [Methylophilaceae bacterium]|jgi:alanine racemase|nr:alanine racemase [Methylophilaceae bacterium]NBQ84689.1 alanine racemase [Methylophilaceae bacterium]